MFTQCYNCCCIGFLLVNNFDFLGLQKAINQLVFGDFEYKN